MLSRHGTLASSSALERDIPTDRNNENGAETIVKFCLHKFCLRMMFIARVYTPREGVWYQLASLFKGFTCHIQVLPTCSLNSMDPAGP